MIDKENVRPLAQRVPASAPFSKHRAGREGLKTVSKRTVAGGMRKDDNGGSTGAGSVGGLSARGPNGTPSTATADNATARRRVDDDESTAASRLRQGPQRVCVDNGSALSLSFWSRPGTDGLSESLASIATGATGTTPHSNIHTPRREGGATVLNATNAKTRSNRTPHAPAPQETTRQETISRSISSKAQGTARDPDASDSGGRGSDGSVQAPAVRASKPTNGGSTLQPQPGSARERLARERERLRISGPRTHAIPSSNPSVIAQRGLDDAFGGKKLEQGVAQVSGGREETLRANDPSFSGGFEIPKNSRLAPFASDISHILSWKPAARPPPGSSSSSKKLGGKDAVPAIVAAGVAAGSTIPTGKGSATTHKAEDSNRGEAERQGDATAPTVLPATMTGRAPAYDRTRGSVTTQTVAKLARAGAAAMPGSATRSGVSAALGALRVRVSGASNIDEDEEDEEDDDEPIQTSSGATVRRRSADSPLRPSAMGRSATLPAIAPAPTSTSYAGLVAVTRYAATGRASTDVPAAAESPATADLGETNNMSAVSARSRAGALAPAADEGSSSGTIGNRSATTAPVSGTASSPMVGSLDASDRSSSSWSSAEEDGSSRRREAVDDALRLQATEKRTAGTCGIYVPVDPGDVRGGGASKSRESVPQGGGGEVSRQGGSADYTVRESRKPSVDESDEDMSITLAVGGFPANVGAPLRSRTSAAATASIPVAAALTTRAPVAAAGISPRESAERSHAVVGSCQSSPVPLGRNMPDRLSVPCRVEARSPPVRSGGSDSGGRWGDSGREKLHVGGDMAGLVAGSVGASGAVRCRESSGTASSGRSSLGVGSQTSAGGAAIVSHHTDTSQEGGSTGSSIGSRETNTRTIGGGEERGGGNSLGCSSGTSSRGSTFADTVGQFGLVTVQGTRYSKTTKIGRGGSSEVFRVFAPDGRMLALKTVRVDGHGEQAEALLMNYWNEIELLRRLQGSPFIINLETAELDRKSGLINIVLELGETDLDRLIKLHKSDATCTRSLSAVDDGVGDILPSELEPNFVRYMWKQMLQAVHAMHEQRVVHGDLKPANFVLVQGRLKLIDFGIAKAISNDTTNISRDSQLGTLNYMCPEAFKDTGKGIIDPATGRQKAVMKLGRASDVWSLGCILYQMTHGRPPFSHLGMVQKFQAIINPDYTIGFASLPDAGLVETLKGCLTRDPSARLPIAGRGGLLSHAYLRPVVETTADSAELDISAHESELKRQQREIAQLKYQLRKTQAELAERVREGKTWERRALEAERRDNALERSHIS